MVPIILRLEAACFAIVVFVALVYFSSRRQHTYIHRLFSSLIIVSAVNIVFDALTVFLVNNLDKVNPVINFICHKIFLGSLCGCVFITFLYILTLVQKPEKKDKRRPVGECIPFYIGLVVLAVLPIEYVQTEYGNYSFGPYAFAGYAIIIFYFIAGVVSFIHTRHLINRKKMMAIVVALGFIGLCLTVQAIYPTSLISGIGVTALVLAFFSTVENPDAHLAEMLQIEKEKADAASAAKSTFLANMSHEIRTPINAVLGFNEIIMRESSEPKIVEYARDIDTAGKTLLGIITDVLDFSKIESGKMSLIEHEYELSAMVNDVVNMISFRAKSKNLKLIVNMNKNIPNRLYGDDLRIKQVMLNILNNAVKYTNKGSVTLSVDYDKGEVLDADGYVSLTSFNRDENFITLKISVADTGVGIKDEDLKRLFSPFERFDENKNSSVEGTGLGMSIVKRLLDMMNSSLQVQSEYGKGSTFSFEIKQKVVNWKAVDNYVDVPDQAKAERYVASFCAPSARILIVDDVKMNLMVLSALVKPLELRVDTAMSGKEALGLVQDNLYDVIFLDHRMPEMDGIETLSEMKKLSHSLNDGTPVIALTANAVAGARELYLNAGFTDYLSKPVDMRHLEQTLLDYLPKSKIVQNGLKAHENSLPQKDGPDEQSESAGGKDKDVTFNRAEGIKNCGSEELYDEVLKEFRSSCAEYAEKINASLNANDIKNYTIYVHSVKSSARTVGAVELSSLAAQLEQASLNCEASALTQRTKTLTQMLASVSE